MFQDDIFEKWLNDEANNVLEKLKTEKPLTIEDKMILTLKAQTNHFYHLDIELREKIDDFQKDQNKKWDEQNKKWDEQNKKWDELSKQIQNIYKSINGQTWKMISAVGLIVLLGKAMEIFGK